MLDEVQRTWLKGKVDGCFHHGPSSPQHILRNGKRALWHFDLRPLLLETNALRAITNLFWTEMWRKLPFQICGYGMASAPLIGAMTISAPAPISSFIIRNAPKKHGTPGRMVEGNISDLPICFVDDILSSGLTFCKAYIEMEKVDRLFDMCWSLVDFEKVGHLLEEQEVEVHRLFAAGEFLGTKLNTLNVQREDSDAQPVDLPREPCERGDVREGDPGVSDLSQADGRSQDE